MNVKKDDAGSDVIGQALWFESAVKTLCRQITGEYPKTADPGMAIVVDVATTDKKAKELGWPSAKLMQAVVEEALKNLPDNIVERIELDEV